MMPRVVKLVEALHRAVNGFLLLWVRKLVRVVVATFCHREGSYVASVSEKDGNIEGLVSL